MLPAPPAAPASSSAQAGVRKVLLTGFDPFGGETVNPSWLAVHALHGRRIAGRKVVAARLPTVFGDSLRVLNALLLHNQPELVICVGQAGGRSAISLERIAINVNDARIPDNTGAQPIDTPVVAAGPAAYFSTLPVKTMLQTLQAAGIAAEVSQTAGTFVCNHVFYGLMHELARQRRLKNTRGGFIHVPWLPEQGQPGMAQDMMAQALRLCVRVALETPQDVAVAGGALH